jgi:uncharacterized membrane protein
MKKSLGNFVLLWVFLGLMLNFLKENVKKNQLGNQVLP